MNYLLKFDSTYGRFKEFVETKKDYEQGNEVTHLVISDSIEVRITHEENFKDIPWDKSGVGYVIECSGQCLTMERANEHLRRGSL